MTINTLAATERNPDAGRSPLKWAQDQFPSLEEIKPHPINAWDRVKKHARTVSHVRDRIGLVLNEGRDLAGQFPIQFRLG